MCAISDGISGHQHPRPGRRPRARLHDDLHVAAEQHEEPHEAIKRKPGKPAPDQGRPVTVAVSRDGKLAAGYWKELSNLVRERSMKLRDRVQPFSGGPVQARGIGRRHADEWYKLG